MKSANILKPCSWKGLLTVNRSQRCQDDLTKTDMMLKDFEEVVSPALWALCVDLIIGSKTSPTTFFVINGKGSYSLLLGRDWIHANCCIPSTMHQCLIQWVDDAVEIVSADSSFSELWSHELSFWSSMGEGFLSDGWLWSCVSKKPKILQTNLDRWKMWPIIASARFLSQSQY